MEQTQKKSNIGGVNIVFLISILITVIMAFLPLGFIVENPALQIIFGQLVLILPSAIYMVIHKMPYAETVRFKKMKLADMAWCILFGILIQPILTLINALSMVFSKNMISTVAFALSEQVPLLVALFLMAVLPGVLEETVYRGVFYHEYSKLNPWKAALLSGFLFGLMHGNINQFCYAAVMGIIFALLIEATGSILSTMLIHFWTNAGSVLVMYLFPKLYEVMQSFYNMYKESGNEEMVAQLELAFGDMTMTSSEWMQQIFAAPLQTNLTVLDVLTHYGLQAVIMGILAFFVYKKLAVRNGNWERVCGFFKKQPKTEEEAAVTVEAEPKQKMVTAPLVVAVVIGIAFMIFCEILLRMA